MSMILRSIPAAISFEVAEVRNWTATLLRRPATYALPRMDFTAPRFVSVIGGRGPGMGDTEKWISPPPLG